MEHKEIISDGVSLVHSRLREHNRKLLYMVVAGSHAWGLERPDSDIDFRGIYQEPTMKILGIMIIFLLMLLVL